MSGDKKTFEVDGKRPIENSKIEIADTYEEDGTRPIGKGADFLVESANNSRANFLDYSPEAKSNSDSAKSMTTKAFAADGIRPIKTATIEVADTYKEDGTRPIAQSPDFLLRNRQSESESSAENNSSRDRSITKSEGQNPVGSGGREVVATFEADGTRPIMSNKYDVVDTLGVDGSRPITDESNIGSQ
ncbi:MAG: hypothetical protein AAFQ41_10790 [Cyanobacteria bacterium J06623_7]